MGVSLFLLNFVPDVGPFFVEILEDEPFRLVLQAMQECHMSACQHVILSMGVGLCARGACVHACVRGMQAYKHT